MVWTNSTAKPLVPALPYPAEPQTPPPTIFYNPATMIDPYAGSGWPTGGPEFDPYSGEVVAEDPLLVKAMAPLSIHCTAKPPSPPPSKRIDMRLAQPGTDESKPGYMTPLSSYTAQTFWYFWHADMFAPVSPSVSARRPSEDLRSSTSVPFDSEGHHRHLLYGSVHPKQVLPDPSFSQFVISILHSTQVSFSVTILALMYTYKYKKIMALKQRPPYKSQVTDAQAFVTAVMLANKYLDDNTYTNSTWAAFLKIPVKEVNDYELEWLDALQFNLNVRTEEFETWRAMLDAHVRTQQRSDGTAAAALAVQSPSGRARSASPPLAFGFHASQGIAPTTDQNALRKRTAGDAFATDAVHSAGMYEAARLGARKSSFVSMGPITFPPPNTAILTPAPTTYTTPSATLGRSSSLNRQIARLPLGGRRESSGQEQMGNGVVDLRHAATVNAAQNWQYPAGAIPMPQPRLYFLQAAATPMSGQDGRFHKGIPHYFDPSYAAFDYPMVAAQPQQDMMDIDMAQVDLASPSDALHLGVPMVMPQPQPTGHPSAIPLHAFPEPQPAPFANAGPPGYAYGAAGWARPTIQPVPQPEPQWQQQQRWKPGHMSRWSASSDENFMFNLPRAPVCHTEWPTPVQVRF